MPNLFIIAGCNGAGKTTASLKMLPKFFNIQRFINADEIARTLAPDHPESVAFLAGRMMLAAIKGLIREGTDFAFETTLASRSFASLCRDARRVGYQVYLMYFWLNSPQAAIERVASRVASGGHHVPDETVLRRYFGGLKNLLNLYQREVDFWQLIDSSSQELELVAERTSAGEIVVYKEDKWVMIQNSAI